MILEHATMKMAAGRTTRGARLSAAECSAVLGRLELLEILIRQLLEANQAVIARFERGQPRSIRSMIEGRE